MHYENKGYANDSKGDFEHGTYVEGNWAIKEVNKYSQMRSLDIFKEIFIWTNSLKLFLQYSSELFVQMNDGKKIS